MSKVRNIQEVLHKYEPGSKISLAELHFDGNDRMMTWQINNLCNFNCPYCGHYVNDDPYVYKYSPEHISSCFDKDGFTWHIIITGGEPFLHKNIIPVCKLLTRKHYISLNTNLSQANVYEFADTIDPSQVLVINASVHFSVRKERNIFDDYIKKFLYLQQKGFNVVGSYVVYPASIDAFESDIEWLHAQGMKQVSSKVFEGEYNGKLYPDSYSEDELCKITKHMCCEIEMPQYLRYRRFKGLRCSTGRLMLSLKPNGDLERCLSEPTPLGNFFTGNYILPRHDKTCKTEICTCPYQGMLYTYRKSCGLPLFKK
ncbi:MAG TPA: radical SAM protein [Bacteroidales bacterium]|nr:radical SAM protein [Bacteroidales bacterium]